MTIIGQNDSPVAKALSGATLENGAAVLITPDFTDIDNGDTQTISIDTTGTLGKVTLSPDGTFAFDANGKFEALQAGATATDTFTYTVTDAAGAFSTKTVTVTINGQNDDPFAMADFNGVVKNGAIAVSAANGVLKNDSDIDSVALSVVSLNGSAAKLSTAVAGTYGALTLKADGSYGYVANTSPGALPAKIVAQDHFTYAVGDGQGGLQSEELIITVYNKGDTYLRGTDGADRLTGGNGSDVLDGGNGNDILIGGNGHDALLGGRGNDTMTGGAGPDTFVFNQRNGIDTITDFEVGKDLIQFDKTVFADFASVLAHSAVVGNAIVIDTGNGHYITLTGHTTLNDLHSSDFVFM